MRPPLELTDEERQALIGLVTTEIEAEPLSAVAAHRDAEANQGEATR